MGHQIDWTRERVTVCYSGHCSEADVLETVKELQSDLRFDSTHQALHDFRQCKSFSPSPEHLEEIAVHNIGAASYMPRLKIAVVANRPDVQAMVERFNALGLSPYPLRTFENPVSANAWLDSTPSSL